MTKSVTGLLAAQMIESGVPDANAPLSRTVPELPDTPFVNAPRARCTGRGDPARPRAAVR
ncbi:hypothetical protein [Burkholderia pseudomallei]|uniref:hypothetical protein n=1 Tax=Burkholderia pseudomallei TaxID=28450 RepID=UPI001E2EDD41|nr:hypothetical protein [Burkholderia pseudomallei]